MEKEEEKEYDLLFKILLVGFFEVGKTQILSKFCDNQFTEEYMRTLGAALKMKTIEIDSTRIQLQLWDITIPERFRLISPMYYRGAQGIFLVYDITNKESFENINNYWLKEIKEYTNENVEMILIGNKCDLEEKREISKEKGKELADELNIPFYEVSAKNNINIDNIFIELTRNIFENLDEDENMIKYTIQNDFQKLFERKEFCDFEIECKDDQNPLNKIKIPIHKLIIQNRLKINENQIENELYSILSQNSQKEVDILLKWIYFGKVSYQDLSILKEWKNKLSNICKIEFKIGIKSFLKDLEILMNSEETKDFQIISNNQEIKVHKLILITRSELFRGMFNISEDKSNSVHEYSNKQTETIQSLIHFFYTDNIPKIKKKIIYEELKECVDYFQLNSERLIKIIQKLKLKKKEKKLKRKKKEQKE
ncbi:ras family-domain-containing protein [Anaeramoeba ignava]|uniref:Ras family-domain-containing protein n=1 Tax=Anaeramoeba ignava TaxID=1746090 RepID=A0A9Q0RF71_ANAIG|nr:ras family-domain-containing protein [Anaeramoeba ignava]